MKMSSVCQVTVGKLVNAKTVKVLPFREERLYQILMPRVCATHSTCTAWKVAGSTIITELILSLTTVSDRLLSSVTLQILARWYSTPSQEMVG